MPRVVRQPRNSVNDRPGRLKLLLRRQRRLLRRGIWLLALLPVLLLGALVMRAGHNSSLVTLRERLGALAADAGLRVTDIQIQGRANTPEPLLRAAIGVAKGDATLGFSLAAARARIETLAWVQQATVERRLPGTIVVQLVERRPFAIWQHNHKFVLVDRAGQIVADEDVGHFKDLPLIVGAGAPAAAAVLLDALRDRPAIQSHVIAAVRIGERRWNLRLATGGDVLLPEGQDLAALTRLMALQQEHALLDRPLQVIDLRLPDRLVVRPQPAEPAPAPAAGQAKPEPAGHPEPQRRT
jgi:cell division protein FtsQ